METRPEIGQRITNELNKELLQHLEEAGLTRPYYLQIIKECCEATKSISCNIINKPGKDKSPRDADSTTMDFVDVPDYRIRLDAVKTIIDLYGDKAPAKQDISTEVNIHTLSPELQDLFESIYGAK